MEQPLVSVIVPVYNAGDHIARCIESIKRQSYQNLEIIIVNDGSKDVSLHVCEMYARVCHPQPCHGHGKGKVSPVR